MFYTILGNIHNYGTCAYLIMSQDMITQYIKFTLKRNQAGYVYIGASQSTIPMRVNRAYVGQRVSNIPTKL